MIVCQATLEQVPRLAEFVRQQSTDAQVLCKHLTNENQIKALLASEYQQLFIAQHDESIIGVCWVSMPLLDDCDCEDLREIQVCMTNPVYDVDLGKALIRAVSDALNHDATVQRLSVFVSADHMAQIKFYAKLGFYHDQVEDVDGLWYMELDL